MIKKSRKFNDRRDDTGRLHQHRTGRPLGKLSQKTVKEDTLRQGSEANLKRNRGDERREERGRRQREEKKEADDMDTELDHLGSSHRKKKKH